MKKTGDIGEQIAASYLERKGYTIVERNWRGVKGMRAPELDIVARDKQVLVFIEVKTTTSGKFGQPQEWITDKKKRRLIDAANVYIALDHENDISYRFDAVVVDKSVEPPEVTHIENAFSVSDI